MTAFLSRLGDRINPIVVKETRQAVNSRFVPAALLLLLAIQLVVMMLMLSTRDFTEPDETNLRAGRELFTIVQGILLGTCMLMVPAVTGARLAAERSDVNVDLLFISSLTPRAVLAGKLAAAVAVVLLIFSACAPFMTFAYLLRGLDVPTILLVLAADFLVVLYGTMLALFVAAVPANRGFRVLLGIGTFIALCYLFGGSVAVTAEFLHGGMRADTTSWEFWAAAASLAGLVLGLIGLAFVWAVALISPPAANRALPVRVYTLLFWLATGAGCAVWSRQIGHPGPVLLWGVFGSLLFALQLLIAVSEPDRWGPRIARRIPRNGAAQAVAFVFYSGAAGGVAFAVLGGLLTVVGVLAWHQTNPGLRWPDRWWEAPVVAGLILGYAYCYSLTAGALRGPLQRFGVLPSYTWVAALLLLGLGTVVPLTAEFALYSRAHYGSAADRRWLYLPSPFVTVNDATNAYRESNTGPTTIFLILWGVAVTVVNVPWLARQLSDFRPPARPAAANKPPAEPADVPA